MRRSCSEIKCALVHVKLNKTFSNSALEAMRSPMYIKYYWSKSFFVFYLFFFILYLFFNYFHLKYRILVLAIDFGIFAILDAPFYSPHTKLALTCHLDALSIYYWFFILIFFFFLVQVGIVKIEKIFNMKKFQWNSL